MTQSNPSQLQEKVAVVTGGNSGIGLATALRFRDEGASIVLVSSTLNHLGLEGFSVYSATKAALRSLARTFANELKGRGIRVNLLSLGPVETPLCGRLGLPQ